MATQFLDLKTGVPANAVYAATDWVAYTATISNLAGSAVVGSQNFKWRRDGGDMLIAGGFALQGGTAGAGTGVVTVSLPTGYQIDLQSLPNSSVLATAKNFIGLAQLYTTLYLGVSEISPSTATSFYFHETGTSTAVTGADFVVGSEINMTLRVPIVGWNSQTIVANQSTFLTYPSIVSNSNFELSTSGVQPAGWELYADAAASSPVNATGGVVTSGLTFLASNVNPLAGSLSAVFSKPASNCQGQGASFQGTMPLGYRRAGKQQFTVLIDTTDSNYAAGDLSLFVYDVTNSTVIQTSTSALPAGYRGQWSVTWDSTLASEYRAVIHVASTSALAYSVKFDEFRVGPGEVVQIPVVSESITFTPPTITGFGVTTSYLKYQIIGSSVRIYGTLLTGSPSATPARIVFPNNWTSSPLNNQPLVVGRWHRNINGTASNRKTGTIFLGGTGSNFVSFGNDDYTTAVSPVTELNGNLIGGSEYFSLDYTVQIDQLIGSGTANVGAGAQIEYASNNGPTWDATNSSDFTQNSSSANGSLVGGTLTALRDKIVRFSTPIQSVADLQLEFSGSSSGPWIPAGGVLNNGAGIEIATLQRQNTIIYGAGLYSVSTDASTDVRVRFGQYRWPNGATYGVAGDNWPSTIYWRVYKAKPDSPVGFGLAGIDGSSGLVSSGKLPGITSGLSVSSGYVGQIIVPVAPTFAINVATTGTVQNLVSFVVPAGNWKLEAFAVVTAGNAVPGAEPYLSMAISSVSASIATAATLEGIAQQTTLPHAAANIYMYSTRNVNIATSTTYYMVARAGASSGQFTFGDNSGVSLRATRTV